MSEKRFFKITATIVLVKPKKNSLPIHKGRRYHIEPGIVTAKSAASAINKAKAILAHKFGYKAYNYKRTIYFLPEQHSIEVGGWTDFTATEIKPPKLYSSWQKLVDSLPKSQRNLYHIVNDTSAFIKRLEDFFAKHGDDNVVQVPADHDFPMFVNGELAITEHNLYLATTRYE